MGRKKNKKSGQSQKNQLSPIPPPASAARPPRNEDKNEDTSVSSGTPAKAASPTAPPAAASVMECDICKEKFDERSLRPRNLLCGHAFCSHCCRQLLDRYGVTCPNCRKTTPVEDYRDLPVNYPLLNMMKDIYRDSTGTARKEEDEGSSWDKGIYMGRQKKKQTSPHGGKCLEAKAEVVMHCAHCDMWLCKDCSHIDHRRPECALMPYQETLKEMCQTAKTKCRDTQQTLEDFYSEVNAYGGKLSSCVSILEIAGDCIRKEQSHLPDILSHCKKLEQDLTIIAARRFPDDLKDTLCYLDGLETATEATKQWVADASTTVLKVDQLMRLSKALLQIAVQLHTTNSDSIMGLHRINGIDVTLPLEVDGSRLLLHAAQRSDPVTGCRVVKLEHIKSCIDPSCALTFLDISLMGRELGRVFIRLLGSTKRSRCFLMMCTGEAGPSFKNTRFHRVWWMGQPGEHLWTGDYNHGDGNGGSLPRVIQEKTKNMSNEKTQVPIHAGLVAGRYGNNNSTIFRVYTRESTDVKEEFALGWIEYGLQVFKDALQMHNIITDLTISGCGVVVEP